MVDQKKSIIKKELIRYFAYISCPSRGEMLGFVTLDCYEHWLNHNTKIILHLPRALRIMPTNQPGIMNVMLTAPISVRTNQRKLAIAADVVELVAEVDQNEDGDAFCKDSKDLTKNIRQLFSDYLKSLEQWRIELSELAIPQNDIVLPDNVTPLNPNINRPPK